MSYKIRKNDIHLRDEATQVLLPIGMLASGGDESLRDFKRYTEKTVKNTISTIETKKAETLSSIPSDYSALGDKVRYIMDTYFNEYKLGSINDFNYISGQKINTSTGKYEETTDTIKCFDTQEYFRIADDAETITFEIVDAINKNKHLTNDLYVYDKYLNLLKVYNNGGSTFFDVLKSNNENLTADARYVKFSFEKFNGNPLFIFADNMIPIRFLTSAEYAKTIKSEIDKFDFIKNTKPFAPSDYGQTIIEDFVSEKDHMYRIDIKSSKHISGTTEIKVGIEDDNSFEITESELFKGTSVTVVAKSTTEFSRVFIAFTDSWRLSYDKDTTITASIRDITSANTCNSVAVKSDLEVLDYMDDDLDYFRRNGLLTITPNKFKWRIGSLSDIGKYVNNKSGIVSHLMELNGKIRFTTNANSMIMIYIYNENEVFTKSVVYDLNSGNKYQCEYSFDDSKLYRICYCRGQNGQSTSNITTDDQYQNLVNSLNAVYTEGIIDEGYMITSNGNGTFRWQKAVKNAVIDNTLSNRGECAEAKATGEAIKNLNTKLIEETESIQKSVNAGKTKVASAITGKGVATENTDTFDVMAGNIEKIPSGGGVVSAANNTKSTTSNAIGSVHSTPNSTKSTISNALYGVKSSITSEIVYDMEVSS